MRRVPLAVLRHRLDAWWSGRAWVPRPHRVAQGRLLHSRICALARVLAVLVLVWIPLDLIGLSTGELAHVLPLRLLLALGLLWLTRAAGRLSPTALLRGLLWLQVAGFGAMLVALGPSGSSLYHLGYGLSPFLVAAQLAMLPLPWVRIARAALVPVWLLLGPALAGMRPVDTAFWNDIWLYVLSVSVAAWAGHTQLTLLVDLLGAQRDALHDALTGLANRRAAEIRLAAERARAHRHGTPLSVLLIDIDHFKHVNDRWGHANGDHVLASMARLLAAEMRQSDLAARFGGEEFLVLLPDTDGAQALEAAERIRRRIEQEPIELPVTRLSITVSIGVATLGAPENEAALLARADAALYRAKAEGRNRSVLSGTEQAAATAAV